MFRRHIRKQKSNLVSLFYGNRLQVPVVLLNLVVLSWYCYAILDPSVVGFYH